MEKTLIDMFRESVERCSSIPLFMGKKKGEWTSTTYREAASLVKDLAGGLQTLGVKKGDRIALISENRPEWALTDLAILHSGAVNVALFPTLPAVQVEHILRDSGAGILVVSDRGQAAKALEIKRQHPHLTIIAMDPSAVEDGIHSLEALLEQGRRNPLPDSVYNDLMGAVTPRDPAAIVYTSGTCGEPKGAVLSHNNFSSNAEAAYKVIRFGEGERLLSFLPLNHVMGRLVDHYLAIRCGSTVAYAESLLRLRQNLLEIKPHYMVLVPRVLDMFKEGILANVHKVGGFKERLFNWALTRGTCCYPFTEKGEKIPFLHSLPWDLADSLVLRKIRTALGLDNVKFFFAGGAPLSPETARFFYALRLKIMEGYGLTETSPLVTVNPQGRLKFGTVGPAVDSVEVRIAGDGEILVRGPNVMEGYYGKPEETAGVIDGEGWFHTGDIGRLDGEGYLTITDRKKNLLVLSTGKKVAPQPIEASLSESPFISQVILFGDRESVVSGLIVPSFAALQEWIKDTHPHIVADKQGMVDHPIIRDLIQEEIERLSGRLADFEKVRRFTLLDEEFSVENNMLTPTLKVRRAAVIERYGDRIAAMYR